MCKWDSTSFHTCHRKNITAPQAFNTCRGTILLLHKPFILVETLLLLHKPFILVVEQYYCSTSLLYLWNIITAPQAFYACANIITAPQIFYTCGNIITAPQAFYTCRGTLLLLHKPFILVIETTVLLHKFMYCVFTRMPGESLP